MSKIWLILFCSLHSVICLAQYAHNADSVLQLLNANHVADSNRVKNLLVFSYLICDAKPDTAMTCANEAIDVATRINWQLGIALAYRQKGYVYYALTDNVNAMDYFLKALKAGEILKNNFLNAAIYNNIANVYADLKNYQVALDYYQKYLSASIRVKSQVNELRALNNIADVYIELNNFSKGLGYYKRALAIADEEGSKEISAAIYNNLGETFLKQKDYALAYNYYTKSLQLANESMNVESKANALNGLAEIFLNKQRYTKAEAYSKLSLHFAKQINDISSQANAFETLCDIYKKTNRFQNALWSYTNEHTLKDSILNDRKTGEITRLEMQYQFNKKSDSIKIADYRKQAFATGIIKQDKVVKNSILTGSLIVLFSSLAVFVFYKRKRDAVEKKHESELKAQAMDTEMKALRAQMNPHFIFNSLNSIKNYIDKNDTAKASLYTSKFAKLMRMILENSEKKEIPIAQDLKALELYMQLEALRMHNKFVYEINVDDAIDQENTLIPPLILQPFVENSIWHGLSQKESDGKIWISIRKEGNMINCIVEDNGVGITEKATDEQIAHADKKSLGMKITKSRIDVINRVKKTNATVTFSNLDEGTKIEVRLPEALAF
ncbi:MAG TPA: tetratricopeptide repeat protein [Ginsengibacter sp.]